MPDRAAIGCARADSGDDDPRGINVTLFVCDASQFLREDVGPLSVEPCHVMRHCITPRVGQGRETGGAAAASCYQMSPTVKPFANGSVGSATYDANPVIQACPVMVGTIAR